MQATIETEYVYYLCTARWCLGPARLRDVPEDNGAALELLGQAGRPTVKPLNVVKLRESA